MISNRLYKSFIEKEHFQANMKSGNNFSYTDNTPPELNKWTFNVAERAMHVNAGTGSFTYIRMKIGKLYVGDLIKAQADFQNITGIKAKIGVDFYTTQEKFDISNWERETLMMQQSDNGNQYTVNSIVMPVYKDGWYDITFGLFTNDVGEFKMRNLLANIETMADTISSVRTW